MIHLGDRTYRMVFEHKDAWNPEAFRDRYSEVLDRYDFIVGDWGYNQLRLKGFFKESNPKATKDTSIAALQDYLHEYCNFGCAYFVIERVSNPNRQHDEQEERSDDADNSNSSGNGNGSGNESSEPKRHHASPRHEQNGRREQQVRRKEKAQDNEKTRENKKPLENQASEPEEAVQAPAEQPPKSGNRRNRFRNRRRGNKGDKSMQGEQKGQPAGVTKE